MNNPNLVKPWYREATAPEVKPLSPRRKIPYLRRLIEEVPPPPDIPHPKHRVLPKFVGKSRTKF